MYERQCLDISRLIKLFMSVDKKCTRWKQPWPTSVGYTVDDSNVVVVPISRGRVNAIYILEAEDHHDEHLVSSSSSYKLVRVLSV
jgi:hypothetical protein